MWAFKPANEPGCSFLRYKSLCWTPLDCSGSSEDVRDSEEMWWMFFNILGFLIYWTINQLTKKTMRRVGDKKVSDKCSLEQTRNSNCDWLCADLDTARRPDSTHPRLRVIRVGIDLLISTKLDQLAVVCFSCTSQKQIMNAAHLNTVRAAETQLLSIKADRKSSESTRF